MTDIIDTHHIKPRKPGPPTARANGGRAKSLRRLRIGVDDDLFMLIKRFAMRTNRSLSEAVRHVVRARLQR
jgi:hypothetical protein